MRNLLIIGLMLLTLPTWAQFSGGCPAKFGGDAVGGFTATPQRGCAPLKVVVAKTNGVQSEKYWFNYRGGDYKSVNPDKVARAATDTTYTKPGKYVILQFGSQGGTASFYCQEVEVLATPKPKFTVVSCSPFQVTVTIPKDSSNVYDFYDIDYGDGTTANNILPGSTRTSNYVNTTARTIRVTGRYSGVAGCSILSDPQSISPTGNTPTRPAIVKLELTSGTSARLDYTGKAGTFFDIYQKTSGGTYARVLSNVGGSSGTSLSQTIQGLTNTGQYCFKVATVPTVCLPAPLESDELCSIPLTVTAADQQNDLKWTAHPTPGPLAPFRQYVVTKNALPFSTVSDIATTQATDRPTQCGVQYCYQVTATVGAMQSVSERTCVNGINITSPPALKAVYATVEKGKILLIWERPTGSFGKFHVSRASGGGSFQAAGDTTTNRFLDAVSPDAGPFCYQVSYDDLCGNTSVPSATICPVFLKQSGNTLVWTPYQTFPTGLLGYYVEQLDEAGRVIKSTNVATDTRFDPDLTTVTTQVLRYRVRAVASNGFNSYSNDLVFELNMKVFVPDAFSPNGDNQNDRFMAKGLFIQTFKMTIFDRWGEPLYNTDQLRDDQGWDGTYNGQPLSPGSYVYLIQTEDSRGKSFTKRGVFLLIR